MQQSTLLHLRQTLRNVLEELEQEIECAQQLVPEKKKKRRYRDEINATKRSYIKM